MTTPSAAIYRGMDRAALDAAYNNSAAVADSQEWLARWRERSAAVRARGDARLDIAYGTRPRTRLDYFPSGQARAPLFVAAEQGFDPYGAQKPPVRTTDDYLREREVQQNNGQDKR